MLTAAFAAKEYRLQWSHDLSAMDTLSPPASSYTLKPASMEPCPFSHGYDGFLNYGRMQKSCFNGAMTFQPWILRQPVGH